MRIRFLRQELGLSQFELAEITGIPRYKIQLFEQQIKVPSKREAQLIARAVGARHSERREATWNSKKIWNSIKL